MAKMEKIALLGSVPLRPIFGEMGENGDFGRKNEEKSIKMGENEDFGRKHEENGKNVEKSMKNSDFEDLVYFIRSRNPGIG